MAEVANDGTRARQSGAKPRRGLPFSGRLAAAVALIGLSGLMLVYWLTYSVPRCTPDPVYRNIPPIKTGAPDANLTPAPEVSSGSEGDRKSTRLNSSHRCISYAVFCLKKKNKTQTRKQE